MEDYIVRATAAEGQVRAFAALTTQTVETARQRHGTSPVATAALGRLLTAGAMMGSMMKNDTDMLTLQIRGDGPLNGITVTADSHANVKGYVGNPDVMLPPKNGKLDVGGAVGIGLLQVIKDLGLKEPYSGQTILVTSEIAGRPDLLFCQLRAGAFVGGSGSSDGEEQYRALRRRIHHPDDALCNRRHHPEDRG